MVDNCQWNYIFQKKSKLVRFFNANKFRWIYKMSLLSAVQKFFVLRSLFLSMASGMCLCIDHFCWQWQHRLCSRAQNLILVIKSVITDSINLVCLQCSKSIMWIHQKLESFTFKWCLNYLLSKSDNVHKSKSVKINFGKDWTNLW